MDCQQGGQELCSKPAKELREFARENQQIFNRQSTKDQQLFNRSSLPHNAGQFSGVRLSALLGVVFLGILLFA